MNIRKADITDSLAIWQISKNSDYPVPELAYTEESIKKLFAKGERILIAELTREPIGYVALKIGKGEKIEIDSIEVRKGHHGQGIGTKLLKKAEEVAGELEKKTMFVYCHPRNKKAIKFYHDNEYKRHGLVPDHYSTGEPAIVFSKKVN